jgi:nucleoid-associated protein YgaU
MRRLAHGVLGLTLVAAPAAHAASEPLDPTWQATTAESVSAAPSAKVETGIPELLREQGLEPPLEVAKPTQRPMERVEELGAPPPVPGRSSGVDDAELASPKAWTPPASPAPNGLLTRAQTRDSVAPHRTVEVRPGDSLWSIAARHLGPGASATDIAEAWPEWFEANRSVIGDNPHMIRAGLLLDAPQR